MYFILSNPNVQSKLLAEIGSPSADVSYNSLQKLPYLTACIDEGMRLHFIIGVGLPRYVPQRGATISGRHFPGGYKVVLNPPVIQTNQEIFGEDAHDFRPERWLESEEEKIKLMRKYFHPWGYGTRVCQGRFIALMEMYKFVADVLPRWEFEFAGAHKRGESIQVIRGYMQQPSTMMVKVRRREG